MLDFSIYRDQFVSAEMGKIWSEDNTVSSWLQVEQALAACQAEMGIIDPEVSEKLQSLKASDLDTACLQDDMALVGRPIVGLVKQLRAAVGTPQAASVHFGSTTQDIMDTAMVLQMHRGLLLVDAELDRLLSHIEQFGDAFGATEIIGRTNGQHAVEMTLGAKLDVWKSELKRRHDCLKDAAGRGLNVQCGGPVGDLRAFPADQGRQLKQSLAAALDLHVAEPHWQNARDGVGEIVAALGMLCGSLCKIAHNINLLSSSEIGELFEGYEAGKGSSSSMAHKRNQRGSEFMEAIARLGRQQSAAIQETNMHQHERSGGVWISEWLIVPDVFKYTSGALMWGNRLFSHLCVDTQRASAGVQQFRERVAPVKSNVGH